MSCKFTQRERGARSRIWASGVLVKLSLDSFSTFFTFLQNRANFLSLIMIYNGRQLKNLEGNVPFECAPIRHAAEDGQMTVYKLITREVVFIASGTRSAIRRNGRLARRWRKLSRMAIEAVLLEIARGIVVAKKSLRNFRHG